MVVKFFPTVLTQRTRLNAAVVRTNSDFKKKKKNKRIWKALPFQRSTSAISTPTAKQHSCYN